MDFHIRPAQLHDLKYILEIYNAEILTGLANWNHETKNLAEFTVWFESLIAQNFPIYVAEEKLTQNIAGYADYSSFRQIHGFKHTAEHSVFIHPHFSRRGLGKALMKTLIQHAKQQKLHVLVAAIDSENKGSIVLHENLAFQQTGYMPQVGQKFGKWRDLVLMQLILD